MRVLAVALLPIIGLLGVAACESAPPAPSLSPERVVEQFMWNYTAAWNKHDAPVIARDFYRQGPSVAEQTMSLKNSFAQLKAQGYDHSDIHEIKGCITGADTAWAGMKFTRLTAAGTPLPPKDRASAYELKKFEDGWRITKLMGADAGKPLACPVAQ